VLKKLIGATVLKLGGWSIDGVSKPALNKYILIAAPHTSNWDFVYLLAYAWQAGVNISWLGKHTIFKPPFGWLFRWLGGVSVDRRAHHNLVEQIAEQFEKRDALVLAIPPEGTRRYVDYWKSGFYFIAEAAGVPICQSFLNYNGSSGRSGGFGPLLYPSGNVREDMDSMRAFYGEMVGFVPEKTGRIRLRVEDDLEDDSEVSGSGEEPDDSQYPDEPVAKTG